MKLFFDFFPIVLFFLAYHFFGIYVATTVAIGVSFLQLLIYWIRHRKFDPMLLTTFALITVLGGATLLLHNDIFIKWKPTVIYWLFGIVVIASQFMGNKSVIQRMLEGAINNVPSPVWRKVTFAWGIFFLVMGILNLYVVYHFSTNAWVYFKLFGILGLTLLFIVGQGLFLGKYIQSNEAKPMEKDKE